MITTLEDNTEIEILNVNFKSGQVDYRRTEGDYTGACVLYYQAEDISATELGNIKAAIATELNK